MRKIIIGGLAAAVGLSSMLASGAFAGSPSGQGAQKRALEVQAGSDTNSCESGSGTAANGPNGFALLNAPGKVGSVSKIVGEVSLKNDVADAGQMLQVYLSAPDGMGGSACQLVNTLTPNDQGNGNAHIDFAGTAGTYFVVIKDMSGMTEKFATSPVPLI